MHSSYSRGTFRFGPLDQVSLVGVRREEAGDYYVDLISHLEKCPFLEQVMPWGQMSTLKIEPSQSNDGPILWIRPGEQTIPTGPNATATSTAPATGTKRVSQNELRCLLRRSNEPREQMFEDR